jgi:5-methylcytosine-specific restriction endonuclease McrA
MNAIQAQSLSDRDLLAETTRAVGRERHATAELLALLGEVDARRLYLGEGCSSLFTYCTRVLRLSEPAAYSRITAARVARRLPATLTRLAAGEVTLTTITLLAAHLNEDNHASLLDTARHKSKRDVERLVAALDPQPDIAPSVRRLPVTAPSLITSERPGQTPHGPAAAAQAEASSVHRVVPSQPPPPPRRPVIAPLALERYLIKVTVSSETHAKFDRARALLRHAVPDGNPAVILDRALTALVEQLERAKHAATSRPRRGPQRPSRGRHVPAAVKRVVWARDEGRCGFVGTHGRCAETSFLEFHHVVPFADGGATDADNLQLRCRAHNGYEAERWFGFEAMSPTAAGGGSG